MASTLKPISCHTHSKLCPLAQSLVDQVEIILRESASNEVKTLMLGREPDQLPQFCVVALESLLANDPTIQQTIEDFKAMRIGGLIAYMSDLTKLNVNAFSYLIQKIYTLYGYEEQFFNDW